MTCTQFLIFNFLAGLKLHLAGCLTPFRRQLVEFLSGQFLIIIFKNALVCQICILGKHNVRLALPSCSCQISLIKGNITLTDIADTTVPLNLRPLGIVILLCDLQCLPHRNNTIAIHRLGIVCLRINIKPVILIRYASCHSFHLYLSFSARILRLIDRHQITHIDILLIQIHQSSLINDCEISVSITGIGPVTNINGLSRLHTFIAEAITARKKGAILLHGVNALNQLFRTSDIYKVQIVNPCCAAISGHRLYGFHTCDGCHNKNEYHTDPSSGCIAYLFHNATSPSEFYSLLYQ